MVHIESVSKQFAARILLKEVSAHLRPGTRVGLVGPNGAGKTTLLRMIQGEEVPDQGTIRKRPRLRIGYLPQELEPLSGKTVLDATHRDLYPEHEAKRVLSGLGFTDQDFGRPVETLSGGYRMRVALAHLLLSDPDLLMLDEPTNHLDHSTQAWFEQFLLKSRMTILVISHDTAFLDRVVTHIWEIRHHAIRECRGNYSKFLEWRAACDAQQQAAATRQTKEIARVQKFVDRFRYQANKASQVQSRIKQLEKIKRIELRRDAKRVRFTFPLPPASGRQVLELRGIAGAFLFSGPDQKKPIKALSGGERNRVALARMLVEPANTLLLDEPTNHLDPASVDVLTDALTGFPGTIVFISHDPTFLSRVATRVVEIEDRIARDYFGDYEYYLWKRAQELESIKESTADLTPRGQRQGKGPARPAAHAGMPPPPLSSQSPPDRSGTGRRELSKTQARLEKQVARVEAEIASAESRIRDRDQELADPALYQDFARWHDLHLEQARWKKDLERLTGRWEDLSHELEGVKQKLAVGG